MNTAEASTARKPASLVARLTVLFGLSAFALLLAAALFLYLELARNLQRDAEDRLRHKVQVLARLVGESPPNLRGIEQEAHEEAAVAAESEFPFYLRVLDGTGAERVATPGMEARLPARPFAVAAGAGDAARRWQAPSGARYLLSVATVATGDTAESWTIQAGFDVSTVTALLGRFRRDLLLMLLAGLLVAAGAAAWLVRRGLRPLQDMVVALEPIGATRLDRRIAAGRWPIELQGVAAAFDRVLDRLQDSFVRLQQFSADLAHELRTPINNLMGESQVALSRPRGAPEYERVLQSSLEELSRLARMIDGMLFLAQADQARMAVQTRPLELAAELRAVADFYQALADEQGVLVRIEGDAGFSADPMLLRRALSNLLSNALRHTPRGGLIVLRARQATQHTLIEVRDDGAGIATEHHARLGDRFFRVDEARNSSVAGSGLGLAIVRSIMALHGGAMRIASESGQGTIVTLEFPSPSIT